MFMEYRGVICKSIRAKSPAGISLPKVNNSRSGAFIINFEYISHVLTVFIVNFEYVIAGWVRLVD